MNGALRIVHLCMLHKKEIGLLNYTIAW